MLVTDRPLVELGCVPRFCESLQASGHSVQVSDGVAADHSEHAVTLAITAARDSDANTVIGFGGGSFLDVAKLAATFAPSGYFSTCQITVRLDADRNDQRTQMFFGHAPTGGCTRSRAGDPVVSLTQFQYEIVDSLDRLFGAF